MDDANTQVSARPFHLLGVVAAFGPALAGGLFLSGYGSERAIRAAFGLRHFGGYDVAILMADGVLVAFLSAVLAICLFMFSLWAIAKYTRWMARRSFQRSHETKSRTFERIVMIVGFRFVNYSILFILLFELILFSFVAMGNILGTFRAHQINNPFIPLTHVSASAIQWAWTRNHLPAAQSSRFASSSSASPMNKPALNTSWRFGSVAPLWTAPLAA